MLEELLNGNIEKKTITQIYGPPGVGKTNICIISYVCLQIHILMLLFVLGNEK